MAGSSPIEESDDSRGETIPFGRKYAESEQFNAVFREGMALVEAAAAYLDGQGRRDARGLSPSAALAYATESMRLTTRLMQLASWLLIRRAVNEGELTAEQALEEKHKVKLKPAEAAARPVDYAALPERLRTLVEASLHLHRRIVRLDSLIHGDPAAPRAGRHPLAVQREWIRSAFAPPAKSDGDR